MWYGILQLAAMAAGFVLVALWIVIGIPLATISGTQAYPSAFPFDLGSSFLYLLAILSVVWAISFVSLICLRAGLKALSTIDRAFLTPSKLTMLLIIATVFVPALELVALEFLLPGLLAPSITEPTEVMLIFLVAGYLILAALGITGVVGGVILGLWRVGDRYEDTTIMVGAILTVFTPVVAQILIIVGAFKVKNKVLIGELQANSISSLKPIKY